MSHGDEYERVQLLADRERELDKSGAHMNQFSGPTWIRDVATVKRLMANGSNAILDRDQLQS